MNDGKAVCNSPAGERRAQMRQYDPCGSVQFDGRSRPAGPSAFHSTRADIMPGVLRHTRAKGFHHGWSVFVPSSDAGSTQPPQIITSYRST